MDKNPIKKGSLVIVGSGIKLISHLTTEAQANIQKADKVFYHIPHTLAEQWVQKLNPACESLRTAYADDKLRLDSYMEMAERILTAVRQGQRVCAVFYGHPGVFVTPSHNAIQQARAEGYSAEMLPGISAEDCLFADLGIDPATYGCQTYEATDFLLYKRQFDPRSHLVLWQIGVIGELHKRAQLTNAGLTILVEELVKTYSPQHAVCLYEAPQDPINKPQILYLPLAELPNAPVTAISTLYIPPKEPSIANTTMLIRLGL